MRKVFINYRWFIVFRNTLILNSDALELTPAPGKMYRLVKTHKVNNAVRFCTSGCNTVIENLSFYTEHVLFELSESMPARIT